MDIGFKGHPILTSCGASNAVKGGAIGAGAGGVIGGVIGNSSGNTAMGAIIGAAVAPCCEAAFVYTLK